MADPVSITAATLEFLGVVIKVVKVVKEMKNAEASMSSLTVVTENIASEIEELGKKIDPNDEGSYDPCTEGFRRLYEEDASSQDASGKRMFVPGPILRQLRETLEPLQQKLRPLSDGARESDPDSVEKEPSGKMSSFKASTAKLKQSVARFRSKKKIRQFEWPFQKQEIEQKVNTLKTLQGQIQAIKIGILHDMLIRKTRLADYKKIIAWLNPTSVEDKLNHHSESLTASVIPGDWLIQDPVFQAWEDGRSWRLALYGVPGSGKTILSTQIISHLRQAHVGDKTKAVIFVHFRYQDRQTQTRAHVMSLLLKQLVIHAGADNISPQVRATWQEALDCDQTKPKLKDTEALLRSELRKLKQTFIILDGLDEASDESSNEAKNDVRKFIQIRLQQELARTSLSDTGRVSLLVTSRRLEKQQESKPEFCQGVFTEYTCGNVIETCYFADIIRSEEREGSFLCKDCAASNEASLSLGGRFQSIDMDLETPRQSIERYIDSLMRHELKYGCSDSPRPGSSSFSAATLGPEMTGAFFRMLQKHPDLQPVIVEKIVAASQCIYMLAHMQWDWIHEFTSKNKILKALDDMPKDLEDHYSSTMQRLTSPPALSMKAEQARLLVMWVSQSQGRLTRDALREAMSISPELFGKLEAHETMNDVLNEGDQEDREQLMSLTRGLVTMDRDTTLHLFHKTAYDYFGRSKVRQTWFPKAFEYMTRCCLVVLASSELQDPCRDSQDQNNSDEIDLVQKRASNSPFAAHAAQTWGVYAGYCRSSSVVNAAVKSFLTLSGNFQSALQLLAYQNEITESGHSLARKGLNELHVLAWFGLDAVLEQILQQDASRVNAYDSTNDMLTPLMYACRGGHAKTATKLLRLGADPGMRNARQSTSLIQAADNVDIHQQNHTVRVLCRDERVDVNAFNDTAHTALTMAAMRGYAPVVAALLEDKRVNVNQPANKLRYTALALASRSGFADVVKLLLSNGDRVDLNLATIEKHTPLHLAAYHGHEVIVDMLLKANAEPNLQDIDGKTPLRHAVEKGLTAIVSLFPTQYFSDEVVDVNGKGLLFGACVSGDASLMQTLLKHGLKINQQCNSGRTVCHEAVSRGKEEVLKILINSGADVSIKDCNGRTAANVARYECGNFDLALLLDQTQSISTEMLDDTDLPATALAYTGRGDILDELVDQSDDKIFVPNIDGETALMIAIRGRYFDCARIIFRAYEAKGEPLDAISRFDRTAMHEAADTTDIGIINLLLSHDPSPDLEVKDRSGATPLVLAIRKRNADATVALLGAGAELDSAETLPGHTLEVAIEELREDVVRTLVIARFPIRRNHLVLAKEKGAKEILKLLKRHWTFVRNEAVSDASPDLEQSDCGATVAPLEAIHVEPTFAMPDFSMLETRAAPFTAREAPVPS